MEYDDYDAVVFDLDGTLVDLAVDWDAAERAVAEVFAANDVDVGETDLWGMLDLADETGLREEVESIVTDHEASGAAEAERLPTADDLPGLARPVAVCSLNCAAAVRTALAVHDLDRHVDAVVGRDSVETRKPDPEPLLAALRALAVPPEGALFVGDGARDAETAERAGVDFRYVGDGPSGH